MAVPGDRLGIPEQVFYAVELKRNVEVTYEPHVARESPTLCVFAPIGCRCDVVSVQPLRVQLVSTPHRRRVPDT
jgi:hypothetical protein